MSDTSCSEGPGEAYLARRHTTWHKAYLPVPPPNLHDARSPSHALRVEPYLVLISIDLSMLPCNSFPCTSIIAPCRVVGCPSLSMCIYVSMYI